MMHYGVNCTYNLSMNFSHIWQILDLISFVLCVKVLLSCVICLAASFYRLEKLFLSELSIRTVETSEVTCTRRNSLCFLNHPVSFRIWSLAICQIAICGLSQVLNMSLSLQELQDIKSSGIKIFRDIHVDESSILNWQGLIVPVSCINFIAPCLPNCVVLWRALNDNFCLGNFTC